MLNKSLQYVSCLLLAAIFGAASAWAAPSFDPNGLEYTNQPALATIKVIDAYNQGYTGSGIKIGVVDSGINPNHVEFANNAIAAGYNNGISGTGNFSFLNDPGSEAKPGHGTFVSSIAAARLDNAVPVREGNIQGVAYQAQLVIGQLGEFKPLTDQRFGDTIDYVSAQGVKVINNSWGVNSAWGTSLIDAAKKDATDAPLTIAALKRAQDRGAVIVFSAGNESVGWPGAPGTLPSIDEDVRKKGGWITVAATTIRGTDSGKIEMAQTRPELSAPKQAGDSYTNYCGDAKSYCISAPGGFKDEPVSWTDIGISGALSSNNVGYKQGDGTSFAAPVVSGAVALVAEKYPWMTNKNLATTILTTGTSAGTPNAVWGRGLLDVGRAINGPGIFEEDFVANVTSTVPGDSSTFSNKISGVAGLNKLGSKTLILSGANTYSGVTAVNDGTLELSGSDGAIASSSGVTISGLSTLKLVNTAASNNTNRLNNNGTVTMSGGTLNFANDAGAVNFSETIGTLAIDAGANTISASQAASGQTSALTFASLTRTAGSTVDFFGTGLGVDTRNRILFNSTPTLNYWATYNGIGFAAYDAASPLGIVEAASTDVTRLSSGSKVIADDSKSNVRIVEGTGSAANIRLGAGTTTINTLNQSEVGGPSNTTIDNTGQTLAVNSILLGAVGGEHAGSGNLTIGTGVDNGTLKSAGTELIVINEHPEGTATINSIVADGTGASALTKSGIGRLTLAGTNTYSGVTTLNQGIVSVATIGNGGVAGNLGKASNAAGNLVFNGGSLEYTGDNASTDRNFTIYPTETASINVFTEGKTLTMAGASAATTGGLTKYGLGILTLSGANLYTGVTKVNYGTLRAGTATKADGSGAFGIGSAVDLTFGGTLDLATFNNTIGSLTGVGNVTLGTATLTTGDATSTSYGGVISGGVGGGLTKAGIGTFTLTGANTYTGATTVNAGTLSLSGSSGAIASSNGVTISGGSTLMLDNTAAANYDKRLNSAGTVTMNGGTLNFANDASANNFSQTTGALTIGAGANTISASQATGAGTSALTFDKLDHTAGSTVDFVGTGLGDLDLLNRIVLKDAPTLGAWATYNSAGFAAYDPSSNRGIEEAKYVDIANFNSTIPNAPTDNNVRINSGGEGTPLTIALNSGTTTINTLLQNWASNPTKDTVATVDTNLKTLSTNGIMIGTGKAGLTIGVDANDGILKAATPGGELNLINYSSSDPDTNRDLTINAKIADNNSSSLTKSGGGRLFLNGENTYSGRTTIIAGTVGVDNGSALGTGAVTNNATLNIGSTALNIGGAYTQGANATLNIGSAALNIGGTYTQDAGSTSRLFVAVEGDSSGSIEAKGKATVHADNSLVLNVRYVPDNTAYTIIKGATGGGAIAAPIITWLGNNRATFAATTTGDELILTSSRAANGFASNANPGDANARAAGVVLDNVHNPSADMSNILNTMDGLSKPQVASALDTLVPQVDAGVLNTDRAMLNNFTGVSIDRVEKAHAEKQSKHSARSGISSGEADKLDGLWAKGYGSYLTQGTRGGIAGYNAWNAGTALGVDRRFTDALTLGISGGYAYGNVNSDANGANTTINSAQTTLYGGYQDQKHPFFVDTAVSFAYNWYDGRRNINVGNVILRTANGSYDGQQYGAYLGGGYKFKFADAIEVTPLVSLQYNNLHINSYGETGAGALNLNAGTQNYNQLQSGLGGRIATTLQSQWGKVTPELHSKWLYDFFGDPFAVTSTFNGGGAAFGANGVKPAINSFNVGGELKLDLRDEIAIIGKVDTELRQGFSGVFGSFTVRF